MNITSNKVKGIGSQGRIFSDDEWLFFCLSHGVFPKQQIRGHTILIGVETVLSSYFDYLQDSAKKNSQPNIQIIDF